ncbi:hypothetical protein FF38_09775 [Lucilia cuprina]|uniref:Uncharacterized protein n=1 Tax=Lucilia cuprina TaxID=7375 RepID=A0A0L0BNV3_LUCCU|nr:hypothetical protein FF38_09775 [Lucilia cuprina]
MFNMFKAAVKMLPMLLLLLLLKLTMMSNYVNAQAKIFSHL